MRPVHRSSFAMRMLQAASLDGECECTVGRPLNAQHELYVDMHLEIVCQTCVTTACCEAPQLKG